MSTSDLLTRMYAMPSELLNQRERTFMQKLHTTLGSPTSATTAPSASCFSASAQISSFYWLLTNSDGAFLAGIDGTFLQWEESADAVPPEYRFCSYQRVKRIWLQIRDITGLDVNGLAIAPVDFYAHRNTPHLWCACND